MNLEQLEAIELLSANPLFAEPRSYNISHDVGFDIPKADLIGAAVSAEDAAAASIEIVTPPTDGSLTINPDGGLHFQPGLHTVGGPYMADFRLVDGDNASNPASLSFTMTNMAPIVQALPLTIQSGVGYSGIVGRITDPDDPTGPFNAIINFGDGTTVSGTVVANTLGGFDILADHTYAGTGDFAIQINVTDPGQSGGNDTAIASVWTPPPVAQP